MSFYGWAWLLLPLGTTRALQICLRDRILRGPREWALRRLNPEGLAMADRDRPYLSFLIECPWCLSVWVAAALLGGYAWPATRSATLGICAVLALSLVAVWLDRAGDRLFPDEPDSPPAPEPPPEGVAAAFERGTD